MDFATLIERMGTAVCEQRLDDAAACFTTDGTYDDVLYGQFVGRDQIAQMFADHFHRDGEDFRWTFHDPVADGETGYARYLFSWSSKLPGSEGVRAGFEGVAICGLRDGLLASYREVATVTTARHLLGFAPERMAKLAAREADQLLARDEFAPHRPSGAGT